MSRNRDKDARSDLAKQIEELTGDAIEDLRGLRKRTGRMEANFRNQRINHIALIATVYQDIASSNELRQELMKLMEMADDGVFLKNNRICRLVFQYAYRGFEKGALYERARKHAAISFEALSGGARPTDIPDLIREAGGVEKLYASQREKNETGSEMHGSAGKPDTGEGPSQAGTSGNNDEDGEDDNEDDVGDDNDNVADDDDGDGDDTGEDNVGGSQRPPNPTGTNGPKSGRDGRHKPPRVPFDPKTDLVVTFSSSAKLYELLGAKVRRALLEVEISSDETEAVSVSMVRWIPK